MPSVSLVDLFTSQLLQDGLHRPFPSSTSCLNLSVWWGAISAETIKKKSFKSPFSYSWDKKCLCSALIENYRTVIFMKVHRKCRLRHIVVNKYTPEGLTLFLAFVWDEIQRYTTTCGNNKRRLSYKMSHSRNRRSVQLPN